MRRVGDRSKKIVRRVGGGDRQAPLAAPMPSNEDEVRNPPRYRQVYEELRRAIAAGVYSPGDRLPSEAELGRRFETSRITVAKAVNDLRMEGLVSRRAGSGTHVLSPERPTGRLFGLLIPDLGRTEIFEPICHGMMRSPLSRSHSLLWGTSMGEDLVQEQEAEELAHQFIAQRVSGVFFAPLEHTSAMDAVNRRITGALDRARIPIVLLDRCYERGVRRSRYDLVGIDNRRAGYLITEHLLEHGVRRIAFVARPRSASTVTGRIAGYREALMSYGALDKDLVMFGNPQDVDFVARLVDDCRPEAVVCANDLTAGRLMAELTRRGVRVPEEMRITGVDDVKYASLLPVPLTTQHQSCDEIGRVALQTMLERVVQPDLPTRDVLAQTYTVVRRSCGAHLEPDRGPQSGKV